MAQQVSFYINDKGTLTIKSKEPVDYEFVKQLTERSEKILLEADKSFIMKGDASISLSAMITYIIHD